VSGIRILGKDILFNPNELFHCCEDKVGAPPMPQTDSHDSALVVCSDRNWAFQSLFLLSTLRASDRDGKLDFYYFSPDAPVGRLRELIDEVARFVQSELPDSAYPTSGHIPSAAYLRLAAIQNLTQRYRRVIYLDADIFLDHGSIAELAEVPLTERPLAAVRDWVQWRSDSPKWFRNS
jgi:lipopolysaccharide biosynthesis glycosyltransferase